MEFQHGEQPPIITNPFLPEDIGLPSSSKDGKSISSMKGAAINKPKLPKNRSNIRFTSVDTVNSDARKSAWEFRKNPRWMFYTGQGQKSLRQPKFAQAIHPGLNDSSHSYMPSTEELSPRH